VEIKERKTPGQFLIFQTRRRRTIANWKLFSFDCLFSVAVELEDYFGIGLVVDGGMSLHFSFFYYLLLEEEHQLLQLGCCSPNRVKKMKMTIACKNQPYCHQSFRLRGFVKRR
jgi:hypothetical protein